MERWQILVNPHAGRSTHLGDAVSAGVRDRGLDAGIHVTASVEDLVATTTAAADEGIRSFAAVGGDGTAHHMVDTLMARGDDAVYQFAMIPKGSGSDFVRTYAHDGDLDRGLDRLVHPDPYRIDVGTISGAFGTRHFINACNVGVAAASVRTAERLPRAMGPIRYSTAFWLTLGRFPQRAVEVDIDHHRFTGDAINVVVANGQFFGGGLNVAPRATMVDGVFDVLVFSGARSNAFTVMPRMLIGSHLTHRAVRRYIGSTVHIEADPAWPVEADGEVLGTGPVTIGILPRAIDYVL